MKATEAILAGVFAGGGSGGGGGASGVLAIHTDPDTGEFDCTFQDVLNEIDAGKYVFTVWVNPNDEYGLGTDAILETFFSSDDQAYCVATVGGDIFYAETVNSRPAHR